MLKAETVRRVLLSALPLALVACQPSAPAETVAPQAPEPASAHELATAVTHWRCDGLPVSTYFDDASLESITLGTPERTLTLKSMADEDGARFADAGGNEFRSRPGRVTLTLVGQSPVECRKDRTRATARR